MNNRYSISEVSHRIFNIQAKTFTYYDDWCGFNIPSNIINDFYRVFGKVNKDLTRREIILFNLLDRIVGDYAEPFYLIGSCVDEQHVIMKHELAHAYWYLYPEYRKSVQELITNNLDTTDYQKAKANLLQEGYADEFVDDEIQAYVSTENSRYIRKKFDWKESYKCFKSNLTKFEDNNERFRTRQ
jgi:hypothetical protein